MKTYRLRPPPRDTGFRRRFAGELNPQQLDVVTAPDGPLLVLAGAGSGKTRTVTYRVAWLLERGVAPEEVVLLTFTNKAAREMVARVGAVVRVEPRRIWGGTFHRVANLILRRHGDRLGYGSSYSILDREDAAELLDSAVAAAGIDPAERRFPKGQVLAAALSYAVNGQRDLSQVLLERWPVFAELAPRVGEVAKRYGESKLERDAMDYDDLLLNLLRLLRDHDEVRRHYAGRFRHVLVDEYQDTNRLQAEIVDLLASEHGNVMVVGDDAQSIYSFRGAHDANILGFPERYPGATVLKLEINYRSTPEILALANAAIARNARQHPKTLRAVRAPGPLPALIALRDAGQQAAFVASRVLELRDEGVPLGEVAVLYRSHWHSVELQMELARRRVPFEVRSGIRFFESAHVKDLLAHLRVAANPRDEISWRRVLRLLPRVGNATAAKLYGAIAARAEPFAALAAGELDARLPKGALPGFRALRELLVELSAPELRARPTEMVRRVLMGEYSTHLHERYEDAESRLEDLNQLALFALGFDRVESFLSDLALSNNLEAETLAAAGDEDEARLVLTTVHQAKGLEWRAVFVLWLVDGRFPSARSLKEAVGEEEERRLFYVAVTRARDELYLCYPQTGRDEARHDVLFKPSRFVTELPPACAERWQVTEEGTDPGPGPGRVGEGRGGEEYDPGPSERQLFDDGPFRDDL